LLLSNSFTQASEKSFTSIFALDKNGAFLSPSANASV
jgi:hypothetical protein